MNQPWGRLYNKPPKVRGWVRWFRRLLVLCFMLCTLPLVLAPLYNVVPVPFTPLMVLRLFDGRGLHKSWAPLEDIAVSLPRAVIAAEDNLFCSHDGFDWEAIQSAQAYNKKPRNIKRGRKKGASTISQQVAKNLFLWPARSWLRKGLEVPLTIYVEAVMPKRRILEIYLNVVEWAPGVYGAKAAAQHYFNKPASKLTKREASLLAAILPSPLKWSASKPSGLVNFRANRIQKRLPQLKSERVDFYACLNSPK